MINGGPSLTDWIGVSIAALTILVGAFALKYAKRQIEEAKASREQTAEIERKKAEPSVVAFMEKAASPHVLELVIKNFGPTPAYNVVFKSDPPIQRTGDRDTMTAENVAIPDVIPFLAPGQEWRTIWDVSHLRSENTNLHDSHDVEITFNGIDDLELSSRSILDWAPLKTTRYMDTLSVHDLAKATKEMAKTIKKATDIHGGFNVWARSGDAKDERKREEARRYRALSEQQREELKQSLEDTTDADRNELQR